VIRYTSNRDVRPKKLWHVWRWDSWGPESKESAAEPLRASFAFHQLLGTPAIKYLISPAPPRCLLLPTLILEIAHSLKLYRHVF